MDEITNYIKGKVDQYELFYSRNNTLNAEVSNDKISFVSEGVTHGIGIRVFVDKKLGFAFTSNLDNFKSCVETAIKVANASKEDKNFKGFTSKKDFKKINTLNKDVASLSPESIHDFNAGFVQNMKEVSKEIMLSIALFSKEISEYRIVNSEGVDVEDKTASNVFQGSMIIKHKGKLESIEFDKGDKKLLDAGTGTSFAERLKSLLNKKSMKTSEVQLILHPDALSALFGQSYAFSVNGENIYLKKSLFHDKLGKKVFDEKLTITDDAVTPNLFCTRPFDNEGTPSQSLKVIEKGVLKNVLYDNYYAKLANKESTGNAYRKVASTPRIAPNNILIEKGNNDVIKEADKAIYVRTMLGTHTMNDATGDFSLGVMEGHYIEKGEIKHPVKDSMIAGNFFEVMNSVQAIGKEIEHSLSVSGGCYLPEILFKKIKVIGN